MSITQIPRLVRSNLSKGQSAGHAEHASGGGAKGGGGGGGGGAPSVSEGGGGKQGGGGSSLASAFDPQPEGGWHFKGGSGILGAIGVTGALDREGKVDPKKVAMAQQLGEVTNKLQDALGQGQPMDQALRGVMRDNPQAMQMMMRAGFFDKGLNGLQKMIQEAPRKGSDFAISGNQVVDKVGGTSRTIQGEEGPMAAPTQGGYTVADDPNNPGQKIIVTQGGTAPGKAGGKPTIVQPNAQTASPDTARSQSQLDKSAAETANAQARTENTQMRTAAGVPYKINEQDSKFLGATPDILNSIAVMKEYGKDANGLISGPASKLMAQVLGTNDPSIVWNNARSQLERSLMMGGVPSSYAGSMKLFLSTVPQVWENSRFNTTDLNMMAGGIRSQASARLANVEQENGGRAYEDQNRNALRDVGVIAPSYGWDNPLALVKSGPDALKNASDEQLMYLKAHKDMLSPSEQAGAKAEILRRAGQQAPQQGQPPQGQAPQGGPAPSQIPPGGPVAPSGQQQQAQGAPSPYTPQLGAPGTGETTEATQADAEEG